MKPTNNRVPKHIGFIMDGNRRFAKRLVAKPWKGHEWGVEKLKKVLEWCKELDVKEVTLYTFSIQNFNRPKEEFDYLMKIFNESADKLLNDDEFNTQKHGVRVNFIGRIEMFPEELVRKMKKTMEMTKNNKKYILNIAVAYGGREEVLDATKKIAEQVKSGKLDINQINEEIFEKALYMNDEPDMIIRTGGENRTSNFLPWQASYSEWFFVDKMWPDFGKEDFLACIKEFNERDRRFGK